jgi:hypothetical protein
MHLEKFPTRQRAGNGGDDQQAVRNNVMTFHPVCLFDMENAEHERYQHQSKCDLVSPAPFSEQFPENENEEEHRNSDVCPMEHQHLTFVWSL